MSYIPYSYAPSGKDGIKTFGFAVPTGGVSFKKGEDYRTKSALLSNFDIAYDGIKTRQVLECVKNFDCEGEFRGAASLPFNGRVIFHMGNCLYSYTGNGEDVIVISDTLPDKDSLFCIFMSKLYIYCDCRVFCVDGDFVFSEQMPDAPLIFEDANPSFCYGIKETYTCYNLVSPRVTVSYSDRLPESGLSGRIFYLPRKADKSKAVKVFADDEEIDAKYIRVEEKYISISYDFDYEQSMKIKVEFFIAEGEETSFEKTLEECRLAISFGGNTSGGTRIFFTGNPNKKGYYYKSDVQNPLLVSADESEVIGDGCENITAVIKMYGNLIIFTEKSVFKITHNLTSSSTYYTIKEISCEAGCDCPGSVQLIDNRVVFANSKKGVFIIDSTNDTGEHNIKPLSGNINRGEGAGLLDLPQEQLKNCSSVDFDRKYMLFVADRAYIWDYNASPFYDSGNYSKAQERLCWYIYEGVHEGLLYEMERSLVIFDSGERSFYCFSPDKDDKAVDLRVKSHPEDFGAPCNQKHVTGMEIVLTAEKCDEALLCLYADGKCCFEKRLFTREGKKNHFIIDCPPVKLYDFSFEISGKGSIKIQNIIAKYKIL